MASAIFSNNKEQHHNNQDFMIYNLFLYHAKEPFRVNISTQLLIVHISMLLAQMIIESNSISENNVAMRTVVTL